MSKNAQVITLFEAVIKACEDGRYCHGNGADWWTVDTDRKTVVVYETAAARPGIRRLNAADSARYLASTPPHRDKTQANILRDIVKTLK